MRFCFRIILLEKLKPISGWCDHIWRISAGFRECRHGENNNEVSHLSFLFHCFTPPPFPWGCIPPQNGHFWGSLFSSLFFSDRSNCIFVRVEMAEMGQKRFFFAFRSITQEHDLTNKKTKTFREHLQREIQDTFGYLINCPGSWNKRQNNHLCKCRHRSLIVWRTIVL